MLALSRQFASHTRAYAPRRGQAHRSVGVGISDDEDFVADRGEHVVIVRKVIACDVKAFVDLRVGLGIDLREDEFGDRVSERRGDDGGFVWHAFIIA